MSSSYHIEEKHSRKQVVSMIYTLEEGLFAAALKVCEKFLFRQSKNVCSII